STRSRASRPNCHMRCSSSRETVRCAPRRRRAPKRTASPDACACSARATISNASTRRWTCSCCLRCTKACRSRCSRRWRLRGRSSRRASARCPPCSPAPKRYWSPRPISTRSPARCSAPRCIPRRRRRCVSGPSSATPWRAWRRCTKRCIATFGGAVNSPLPDRPASAPAYAARVRLAEPALPAKPRHNWFLYAFLVLLPLQNLQTGYMPNLGGGLNFLNVGFGLAMLGALACRGGIAARAPVHGWILAYATYAVFSLFVGFANVSSETEEHFNILKDALLAVMLIFVVEMSVTDWTTLKRTMAAMLLPLPYMLRVT